MRGPEGGLSAVGRTQPSSSVHKADVSYRLLACYGHTSGSGPTPVERSGQSGRTLLPSFLPNVDSSLTPKLSKGGPKKTNVPFLYESLRNI